MINDTLFSKSFLFRTFNFKKYKHTDNRLGTKLHYFVYMKSGKARIVTEGSTYSINEGEAFFLPRELRYQSYWYGTPDIKFISLGFTYLPRNEGEIYGVQSMACSDEEKALFHEIARSRDINAAAIGKLYTLVGMLMPKMTHTKRNKYQDIIEKVKKQLNIDPHTPISKLAKDAAVSQSMLYHVFKTHCDVSINGCRNKVIMQRAKEMLISTDLSIEQISEKLSFSSGAYFRKVFKEHFGISPREMRKKANSFS